jgi:hypothetical protein
MYHVFGMLFRILGDHDARDYAQPVTGDREPPVSLTTFLMLIGFLLALLGFFTANGKLLLAGVGLLGLGLAVVVVAAIVDIARTR